MAGIPVSVLSVITHQLRNRTAPRVHGRRYWCAKRPSLVVVSFLKAMAKGTLRIAATADLHYAKHSRGTMQEAFTEISGSADVLLLCGDLTEYGLPEEVEELAADIRSAVRIPCIGVIGNHDYE